MLVNCSSYSLFFPKRNFFGIHDYSNYVITKKNRDFINNESAMKKQFFFLPFILMVLTFFIPLPLANFWRKTVLTTLCKFGWGPVLSPQVAHLPEHRILAFQINLL